MSALRGPCILWEGALQSKGYGSETDHHGGTRLVHRRAWEEAHGPIPDTLTVDHLCCQKTCINPDHMELVTRAENSRRKNERQTHCKRGHALSGDNLRITVRGDREHRVCRECARIHNADFVARRALASA